MQYFVKCCVLPKSPLWKNEVCVKFIPTTGYIIYIYLE